MAKAKEEFEQGAVSEQFRTVAGLPARTSNEPHDVSTPSELRRAVEPEDGYGGEGEAEVDERSGVVDEELVEAMQDGEELSAKSGLGNTTPLDANTGPTVAGERLIEDGDTDEES